MKKFLTAGAALMVSTSMAGAVGLDRSGQGISALFEEGSYAEFSFGYVMPSLSGNDVVAFGGSPTGNVAAEYGVAGLAYKQQFNDQISFAVIFDQPYGADIYYPTAAAGGSVALGGTAATLRSSAVSGIGRYEFGNGFSAHAGIRAQTVSANVTLGGAAYGGLNGYNVNLGSSTEYGYLAGVAYEKPEIALRLAVTYFSAIDYTFDTRENFAPGVVSGSKVTTPQAVNIDFQTGIAADTLLLASVRWADYGTVILSPATFDAVTPAETNTSLTDIDSGYGYSVGIGRRFSDQLSGSATIGYEPTGDMLVSPLSPSNGNYSIALGAQYKVNDNMRVSGGIRYVVLGDADAQTAGAARSNFTGNDAVAIGIKVAYNF